MQWGGQQTTLYEKEQSGNSYVSGLTDTARFDASQYAFFNNVAEDSLQGGIEDCLEEPAVEHREEQQIWDQYQYEISAEIDQLTHSGVGQPANQPIPGIIQANNVTNDIGSINDVKMQLAATQDLAFLNELGNNRFSEQQSSPQVIQPEPPIHHAPSPQQNGNFVYEFQAINLEDLEGQRNRSSEVQVMNTNDLDNERQLLNELQAVSLEELERQGNAGSNQLQAISLEDLERQMFNEAKQPQNQEQLQDQVQNQRQNQPQMIPPPPPLEHVSLEDHLKAEFNVLDFQALQQTANNAVSAPIMISPLQQQQLLAMKEKFMEFQQQVALEQQQQQYIVSVFQQQQGQQQQYQQQQLHTAQFLHMLQGQPNHRNSFQSSFNNSHNAVAASVLGKELVEHSLPPNFSAAYMSKNEIAFVLRCSWLAINVTGNPYEDDYYFQAYVNKTLGINKAHFAPAKLREITSCDEEKSSGNELVEFVPVEGLGKIVRHRANVPKKLLEVTSEGQGVSIRLEQEPRLAVRVLIEDCFLLILDVEDIDRSIIANQNRNDIPELFQRRSNFIKDLCWAMGLTQDTGQGQGEGWDFDKKFLKLMELEKGRSLLAKVLGVIYPSWLGQMNLMVGGSYQHQIGLRAVKGVLRNLRKIFNAAIVENAKMMNKTHQIAAQLVDLFKLLNDSQDILDCMNELGQGDLGESVQGVQINQIVCFVAPDTQLGKQEQQQPWMSSVLLQLLLKGYEFDTAVTSRQEWEVGIGALLDGLICLFIQIHIMVRDGKILLSGIQECVRRLVPSDVLQLMMQQPLHQSKRDQLSQLIQQLGQVQQMG